MTKLFTDFTPQFIIFKDGITDEPIKVVSKNGEPYDREAKIYLYLSLGYSVYELDGKTQILK